MPQREAAHLESMLEIMGYLERRLSGLSLERSRMDRELERLD